MVEFESNLNHRRWKGWGGGRGGAGASLPRSAEGGGGASPLQNDMYTEIIFLGVGLKTVIKIEILYVASYVRIYQL